MLLAVGVFTYSGTEAWTPKYASLSELGKGLEMGFFDALFGNAPKIKMGTQAEVAPQGWRGDYGQMVGAGQAGQMQSREQQASLAQALQAQMAGRGPNLGALQMQQAQNQNIAGTGGQHASGPGMWPGPAIPLGPRQQAHLGPAA